MTKKFLGPKRMAYPEKPKDNSKDESMSLEKFNMESSSCLVGLILWGLFFIGLGICLRFFISAFNFLISAFIP